MEVKQMIKVGVERLEDVDATHEGVLVGVAARQKDR